MFLEAVDHPIRYTWPSGEILLEPGKPFALDDTRGRKVLAKCGSKVRVVPTPTEPKSATMTGQLIAYKTPVDERVKTGRVEMIDEAWGMVLVRGNEVAWVNQIFIVPKEGR